RGQFRGPGYLRRSTRAAPSGTTTAGAGVATVCGVDRGVDRVVRVAWLVLPALVTAAVAVGGSFGAAVRQPFARPLDAPAAWLLVVLTVGELARGRRERLARERRARADAAARVATEERLRIARDLHDVLAHHVSLINVQAGTALHLLDEQPGLARDALTAI